MHMCVQFAGTHPFVGSLTQHQDQCHADTTPA